MIVRKGTGEKLPVLFYFFILKRLHPILSWGIISFGSKEFNVFLLIRPVGQVVKTPPFHGGITGSNPVRVTIIFLFTPSRSIWKVCYGGVAKLAKRGRL